MVRFLTAFLVIATAAASCHSGKPATGPRGVKGADGDPAAQMVSDIAALQFERLGNPVLRWDRIPPALSARERPHKLLVVLVEFPDRKFDRFAGDAQQADELAAFYQRQLFDDSYSRVDTLSHYYAVQSLGRYHITGQVLPPVQLSQPRAVYGAQTRPEGGSWRNDRDTEGMVEEALLLAAKAHPELAWADFDRWDPNDFDRDGNLDEADGYLDHFVLVFAGGGQASCQLLNQLDSVFTPNAGPEAFDKLDARQRECSERLWPHRFQVQKREGQGPTIEGRVNGRGGVPLSDSLWVFDYNMQSEYIGPATFIHEFGHSIGLPDVYSRTSSNSTGGWEVMSSTASPSPQDMSAWSRLMLGWIRPKVVLPPKYGGDASVDTFLRTLDDPAGEDGDAERAVLVVLPPKSRHIELGALPESSGSWALYSGQGNELKRTAELALDLSGAGDGPIELSFDAWWEIEGGWDFAYVEVSTDGSTWTRRVPTDRRLMPAKHGHDGADSLPGFTGLSGDLDGDGKNESNAGCDPSEKLSSGEDKVGEAQSPCLEPTWVHPSFDLSDLRGQQVRARLRYFTDTAAVMRGILVDNVTVTGVDLPGDFESEIAAPWKVDGFSRSPGHHDLLVPHFYLIEYRDPYATGDGDAYRYDAGLADQRYYMYWDESAKKLRAVRIRTRPGVVVWYYNGAYAWSENDPAANGPGEGYLLALDANPNELALPGLEAWFRGTDAARDTYYDVGGADAQAALRDAYYRTVCFVRNPSYRPKGGVPTDVPGCTADSAPLGALTIDGKQAMYNYQVTNDFLPGEARDRLQEVGELYDEKTRDGDKSYRMRDRTLRYIHTQDGSFSPVPFAEGVTFYDITDKGLVPVETRPHAAAARFDDAEPRSWQNPKLPFGGVAVPTEGFSFELTEPADGAPAGARVELHIRWKQ